MGLGHPRIEHGDGLPGAGEALSRGLIGPNQRPTAAVPICWTANRPMMTPSASGTTTGSNAGVATFSPSIALSTEIAGVSRQSP